VNQGELSEVRRQLRCYYDALKARERELESDGPIFREVVDPLNWVWGRSSYYLIVDGYELRAPRGVRDSIRFCEDEMKRWSVVSMSDKRLSSNPHNGC